MGFAPLVIARDCSSTRLVLPVICCWIKVFSSCLILSSGKYCSTFRLGKAVSIGETFGGGGTFFSWSFILPLGIDDCGTCSKSPECPILLACCWENIV